MDIKTQQHIADLHKKSFTVDAHFDLTYDIANHRERGEKKVIENNYLEDFKKGGFDLIVSAIFIHDLFLPEMGLRRALDQISFLHEEIDESPQQFRLCRSVKEAFKAKSDQELAIFLSLEGADPLQNDIRLLRIFYELGVRLIGLTWSRRNYAGDGAFFQNQKEGKKGGLTPFGVSLAEEAQKLGILLDVSHLNDECFWDLMGIVKRPVIASHSNCRKLADTMRNLTDDQIKAIADCGGVIGMNSVNLFVSSEKKDSGVRELVDHIDHITNLCGAKHVGIGFDICNSFKNFLDMEDALPARDIIPSHGHLDTFTAALIERGYSDEDILGILGGNFLRVFTEVIG